MNDRADRLIKALGDIGEDLIEKAAPVYPADSEAGESIRTAVPAVYEPEVKITRKDRVIYWITRALGMAAAAALIVGAAVLLIMNWDKIAVRGSDRPGVVTTVSESSVSSESTTGNTADIDIPVFDKVPDDTSDCPDNYLVFTDEFGDGDLNEYYRAEIRADNVYHIGDKFSPLYGDPYVMLYDNKNKSDNAYYLGRADYYVGERFGKSDKTDTHGLRLDGFNINGVGAQIQCEFVYDKQTWRTDRIIILKYGDVTNGWCCYTFYTIKDGQLVMFDNPLPEVAGGSSCGIEMSSDAAFDTEDTTVFADKIEGIKLKFDFDNVTVKVVSGGYIPEDTFTYDRPAGSWFELEETLYRIDNTAPTAPFDCVTFNDDGTCSSIFIDEWKEEYDAIGYTSELENITDENFVFTFGFMKQPGEEPRSGSDPDLIRVYSADYKNADKGEALAMRNKYVTMPLNENQIMYIDKYMRDKLNVPYDSIVWDDVYGVYYVDTRNRCELMPDRYYSEVNDDLRHDLFEAMYEADRNSEMDGNPGATYYHTNPLPIVGSDEYIGFWVSGSYNAKIIAAYIIKRDFEGQYRADMKADITDELDRLYIDGAKLMFVKSGGGYYAVTESNRKIELIPGDEGAVSNYEAKFAYRVRPYLPLPDGAAEDIKLGEEQKQLLIKEAYESAQSFENSIPLDRLAVSDPVKILEQRYFVFVFDGDEIVGKIWCFYSDSTENASGFDTGGYDNAVDGLTELYRSGEKVSFTWFGSNLYCCPENAVSYPIEWQVFHKPSAVYLYNAEQGAPIHRNNAE